MWFLFPIVLFIMSITTSILQLKLRIERKKKIETFENEEKVSCASLSDNCFLYTDDGKALGLKKTPECDCDDPVAFERSLLFQTVDETLKEFLGKPKEALDSLSKSINNIQVTW